MEDNEIPNSEDVRERVERHGLSGIEEFFRRKLEKWEDVEITIGVTGDAGVGKSSLINAILGDRVAKTGTKETTTEPAEYTHPKNAKIKLWDLPGLGVPSRRDLETYCNNTGLKKYDTFLILSASRFTEKNLELAEKVESIKKSFFFVRTKIDHDIEDEQFDSNYTKTEEAILTEIKEDCHENLSGFAAASEENVFLISNHHKDKWDFPSLRKAILDALPPHHRESLILSLTSDTKDVIELKVKALRDRIWIVAAASAAVATIPFPGLSVAFDDGLLMKEITLYKSQFGIPEENSAEFQGMNAEMKAKIHKYCATSAVEVGRLLTAHIARSTAEEFARFVPILGNAIAGSISFGSTYWFLDRCVTDLEAAALNFLDETRGRVADCH